jgi:class 3 adenylate cyclase
MDFYEVLAKIVDILQREGRTSYRALKRQFDLDDEYLEDLKVELIEVKQCAVDQDSKMLIWTGSTESAQLPTPAPSPSETTQPPTIQQDQPTQVKPPPTESRTPEAERRQLTVMFCDLADSTKLSGQLDPEDLRDVIRAYQETAAGVIQRYEGHITQYLGDGLLVYFGWPQAHEDDAQRGVHAGLGMVNAMDTLNTRLEKDKGVRLSVRIGIHTGPVVIGEMGGGGRQERLALGETTNIAARLEGLAQPNTVVISDTTYRLVEGYFRCDGLGTPALKGVASPMQIYRVQQATEVQGRLDVAIARGLTPLVGREQEVGLLLQRWTQVKEGQGQVVLLSGEAGIGKSRLVQVLKDHVTDEPHTRLECRSSPHYQNTALYPITDLLQRTLQWQPGDASETKLEKLEQVLQAYRLPLHESVPIFASLLSLSVSEDRYAALDLDPAAATPEDLGDDRGDAVGTHRAPTGAVHPGRSALDRPHDPGGA